MKLSNQEINAIASKISSLINEEFEIKLKEFENSKEYIEFEKTNKECIELEDLYNKLNKLYPDNEYIFKNLIHVKSELKDLYFENKKPEKKKHRIEDIKNDIIISTIGSKVNIEELISEIKSKYSKK